jgi:hypothetical protein
MQLIWFCFMLESTKAYIEDRQGVDGYIQYSTRDTKKINPAFWDLTSSGSRFLKKARIQIILFYKENMFTMKTDRREKLHLNG